MHTYKESKLISVEIFGEIVCSEYYKYVFPQIV